MRGTARRFRGDLDGALADFDRALKIGPRSAMNLASRGAVLSARKEHARALTDLDESVRLEPFNPVHRLTRSQARDAAGDRAGAAADLDEALKLDPKSPTGYTTRAYHHQQAGRYGPALADFEQALKLTCPEEKLRDGKRAVELGTRCCELSHWKDAYGIDTLAAALAESGDFAAAVRREEEAIALLPGKSADRPNWEARLKLYRDRKAFQEEPAKP
jgi:tetratricopeptide (TPR) repeat protein